ncbi:hypothetical protein EMIT0P44_370042 [Pseudomonas sp. IT-P44]
MPLVEHNPCRSQPAGDWALNIALISWASSLASQLLQVPGCLVGGIHNVEAAGRTQPL